MNYFFRVPLDPASALRSRDSMVKEMYKRLFQFLVDTMNKTTSKPSNHIAILDIAGFGLCSEIGFYYE